MYTGRQKYFSSLPVKVQGDYYSFDTAESEYDKQLLHHPPILREKGLYSKRTFLIKKVKCWFLITIYNVK
jgi:hypothetical protein